VQEMHCVKAFPLARLDDMEVTRWWLAMTSRVAGSKGGRSRAATRASSRMTGEMALFFVDVLTKQR
jgi:hypothetical protein